MRLQNVRSLLSLSSSALRLALAAQQVRHERVDHVIPQLQAARYLPERADVEEAKRATLLACRLLGRLGMLNSCLTRSLVLGSLISDRPGVVINFGFRPNDTVTEGHAWISCGQQVLEFDVGATQNVSDYIIARRLPLQRPASEHSSNDRPHR